MRHRYWIPALAVASFLACHNRTELPPDVFPQTAANEWRRTALHELAVSDSPDPVPRNEIERVVTASYEGQGKLDARVYVLSSPAIGLELSQRWRPSAETVFFNSGSCFVVVKWQAAERRALQDFVRELEKRLAPRKPAS